MPLSNAGCFGGGSVFQAMIRPSPALHGFMPNNAYGAMPTGGSNPMYGNIGVHPGRPSRNFGSGMPLLNAPAYDNLTPKGKPKAYKEGGQAVKFDTFHGTHDKLKALLFLLQFDAAFPGGNFIEFSKIRKVLSSFLENLLERSPRFKAENVVLTAGATAALEILGFCLGEAGDAFLVPSPYYPGFDRDFKWRSGIQLVPVYCPSSKGFTITRTALEKAYTQAQRQGITVRAIVITTPGNPVGNILDADTICCVFNFAKAKGIHVISDEIYAASVFRGKFVSASQILAAGNYDSSFVHIVYGLSKDFGIPGFRVGLLYTTNEKILAAAQNFTRFCTVSSHTQRLLLYLLQDKDFIEMFLQENRRRLCNRYDAVLEGLQSAGINCAESSGGLYCWLDLRHLLASTMPQAENSLWKKLLYEVKLNLTPGSACHYPEAGWFRLCFANVEDQTLNAALKRLHVFTEGMRK
ncbi:hypothetical protein L7F22_058772 [Adiantum nelumboides]|nr:hypothetical protein [Adiantum nelumboides]